MAVTDAREKNKRVFPKLQPVSGVSVKHFQEELVHHDAAVFLHVVPELLGQQFDVHDGRQ